MASNIPSQSRAVDPFASYNSNIVNTLTRMVTHGVDGLANANSCDVEIVTDTTLKLNPGIIYKDDVWIEIEADHTIDFEDTDHYYSFGAGFNESGVYYIVLDYTYTKSRPAPQAKILIIKPSQTSAFDPDNPGPWFFLKAVIVVGSGPFTISSVTNYDTYDNTVKREYISNFAGTEIYTPAFSEDTDVSKVIYSAADDNFYFGRSTKWEPLRVDAEGATFIADTRNFDIGDLVYMNFSELPSKANSKNAYIFSDGVVQTVAEEGIIKTNGMCENVQVESGSNPVAGNLMYLSKTESGKVTAEQTDPIRQFVGRCLQVTAVGVIELIYHRGQATEDADFYYGCFVGDAILDSSSWLIGPGGYFQDVDISTVQGKNVVVTVWDSTTALEIEPQKIEFIDNTTMRIWSATNTETANVYLNGASNICVGAESIILNQAITSWTVEDGSTPFPGTNPGTFYYYEIDISDIDGKEGNVLIKDSNTNLQLHDLFVEFDSTSILRIWTDNSSDDVEVVVVGPLSSLSTESANRVISYSSILPNYNWKFWTDAEIEEIVIPTSKWGPSALSANWAPDVSSTIWGGDADSTASTIFEGLYFQDVDLSFYLDNAMVLELYNRTTNKVITPTYIEFLTQDILRIWMDNNTYNLNVTVIGRFSS